MYGRANDDLLFKLAVFTTHTHAHVVSMYYVLAYEST